ncbi:MAG TPA: NapC/NirT family cytochrome c [Thermoanaerobaculia bacterium]|nr:NapC/NirT family cytochrome c [Thermoanaerobaculia bacterium]
MTRPAVVHVMLGRAFAFAALFILPLFALTLGVADHVERSKTTEFCLSCHVMEPYGKSLLVDDRSLIPAVHYQNHLVPADKTCFTCHTDYTMYGDVTAKLRGLRHVYVNYIGGAPKKIALYTPYNNRECLHCHLGSRSFEEGATHTLEEGSMAAIKTNRLSCMSSGCHESTHNVAALGDATLWKEPGK